MPAEDNTQAARRFYEHDRRSDDGEADQQRHLVEVLGAESPFAGGPSLEDLAGREAGGRIAPRGPFC